MKRLIAFLIISSLPSIETRAEIIGMKVNRAVTEEHMKASLRAIELVDEKGAPLDLRGLLANGKPTLVTLWAHWCPNCLAEIRGFKAIVATCPDRWNMVFVSARAGDFPKDRAKFNRFGLPWKIHHVANAARTDLAKASVARAFYGETAEGGVVTPLHYLIAANGVVDAIVNGRMDFEEPQRLAAFCAA